MKAHELFAVFVRALGLWLMVQAALNLVGVFAAPILLLAIVLDSAIGFFLFFATDSIVRATYHGLALSDSESVD
jgi:hypothetical protein